MLPDDDHQIMLDCFFRVIEYIFIFNRKIWHLRLTETTTWLTSVYRLNDESRNTVCAKNKLYLRANSKSWFVFIVIYRDYYK